jgi:hypothetical protein
MGRGRRIALWLIRPTSSASLRAQAKSRDPSRDITTRRANHPNPVQPLDDISCPGRGAAFTLLRRAGIHTCGRDVMGPGSAEHHAATRRSAPRPGHERTRASARRLSQRAENPRPRTNALVETLQVIFFVRRMDVVVVEPKTHQHGVETERALEIRDDRDRGA